MANRDDQREQLRKEEDCKEQFANIPLEPCPVPDPRRQRNDACEVEPECTPDAFAGPTGQVVENIPTIPTPDLLVVGNDTVTVTCADLELGPVGEDVVVPAGEQTEIFDWRTIPDLTDNQQQFLAAVSQVTRESALTATVSELVTSLKISTTQAQFVRTTLDEIKTRLNEQAQVVALGLLDCYWLNEEQTANCPDGTLTSPGHENLDAEVVNPSVIPAGLFQSYISQADANSQALVAAEAALTCWWGNEEVTRACIDLGFEEEVPTDETPVYPTAPLRVGSVVIPANTFFSRDGQEDANNQAATAALNALNCVYLNAEVVRNCSAIVTSQADLDRLPQPPVVADPVTNTPGQLVTIPAGFSVSTVSTADATAQAVNLALTLLDCYWLSELVDISCPVATVTELVDGLPVQVQIPADPNASGNYRVVVPAAQFRSYISWQDAQDQAQLFAEAQLDCIYCNRKIDPLCIPEAIRAQLESGQLTLPLDPAQYDTATWSMDATLGVPAGLYCARTYEAAEAIAEAVAAIPVINLSIGVDCMYGNQEVRARCIRNTETGILGKFAEGTDASTFAEGSYPNPLDPAAFVIIAENSITVRLSDVPIGVPGDTPEERARNYVNEQARAQALSLLNCFFVNAPRTFRCADAATIGGPELVDVHPLSVDNVYFPAGSFRSENSLEEANLIAQTAGYGALNCFYANPAGSYRCADGANIGTYAIPISPDTGYLAAAYGTGTMAETGALAAGSRTVSERSIGAPLKPVVVSEAMFTSRVSKAEVNAQTLTFIRSALNCFWENQKIRVLCGNIAALTTAVNAPNSGIIGNMDSTLVYGTGKVGTSADAADPSSRGSITNPIDIPRGLYTSEESLSAANLSALLVGIAQLYCVILSPAQTLTCASLGFTSGRLHPISQPVDIPKGFVISEVSKADMELQLKSIGGALILCAYTNVEQTPNACGTGMQALTSPTVPEDTVMNFVSEEAANAEAKAQADAMQTCLPDAFFELLDILSTQGIDGLVGLAGLPGASGAQTGCSGQCFGYYS